MMEKLFIVVIEKKESNLLGIPLCEMTVSHNFSVGGFDCQIIAEMIFKALNYSFTKLPGTRDLEDTELGGKIFTVNGGMEGDQVLYYAGVPDYIIRMGSKFKLIEIKSDIDGLHKNQLSWIANYYRSVLETHGVPLEIWFIKQSENML
jgi:hypothetical protein